MPRRLPPPYEVMRRSDTSSLPVRVRTGESGDNVVTGGDSPLLVIPRGIVVLAGLVVVCLVVLTYWVGRSGGHETARKELLSPTHVDGAAPGSTPVGAMRTAPGRGADPTHAGATSPGESGRSHTGIGVSETRDPRQPGLNYLILAYYPTNEAHRLAGFLHNMGVATMVDPDRRGKFARVIAVDQAFTGTQLGSKRQHEYDRKMHEHGRAWKKHNRNRGDALESMYYWKFERK